MECIGEVNEVPQRLLEFNWKIPNFFSLSLEDENHYISPPFFFANESWCLVIYPNGLKSCNSEGYIGLYLQRMSTGPPIYLEYSLGIKTVDNIDKKIDDKYRERIFADGIPFGIHKLVSRSKLMARKSLVTFDDSFTVYCDLKDSRTTQDASSNTANARCPHCKITLAAENIPSDEESCNIKCPKCSHDVILQKWYEHDYQTTSAEDLESVCQDFKKVLLDGSNHDLILRVGDKELRAHRDILKARSQVFYSMLTHDMLEKNSDTIKIPDCDPEAMELFLMYVYCGRIEGLDQSNMFGLYYIADKYEMMNLKEECHNFIKKSLTTTNFCDIIQLALNHCDSSLLEYATDFFLCNVVDILHTIEWQTFLKTNSTVANELFLKSYQNKK